MRAGPLVFLTFVGVPVLEIWLLLRVGSRIGAINTLGVIVLTAVIGTWLVRQQGVAVLRRAQEVAGRGQLPAKELMDGLLIFAAGLLMLTPGFFTDALGLCLLMPPTRALARRWLQRRFKGQIVARRGGMGGFGPTTLDPFETRRPGGGGASGPRAADVEIVDDDE